MLDHEHHCWWHFDCSKSLPKPGSSRVMRIPSRCAPNDGQTVFRRRRRAPPTHRFGWPKKSAQKVNWPRGVLFHPKRERERCFFCKSIEKRHRSDPSTHFWIEVVSAKKRTATRPKPVRRWAIDETSCPHSANSFRRCRPLLRRDRHVPGTISSRGKLTVFAGCH